MLLPDLKPYFAAIRRQDMAGAVIGEDEGHGHVTAGRWHGALDTTTSRVWATGLRTPCGHENAGEIAVSVNLLICLVPERGFEPPTY